MRTAGAARCPGSRAWLPGAVAVATAWSASLLAQAPLELARENGAWVGRWSGQAAAGATVEIRSIGSVSVRGAARDGIRYQVRVKLREGADERSAKQALGAVALEAELQPDGAATLALRRPDCGGCRFGAQLEVEVPEGIRLVKVSTRGGPIEVDRVGGDLWAATVGGRLRLGRIGGSVRGETAGGSIDLESAGGGAELITKGGGVRVRRVEGDLLVETQGGDIKVGDVAGSLQAKTAAGSIRIGDVRGQIRVATAAGSIWTPSAPNGVRAEAGAGDVQIDDAAGAVEVAIGAGDIRASLLPGSVLRDSVLETDVGSIIVRVPEALALTIEASVELAQSLRGILSEFPSIEVRRSRRGFGPRAVTARGDLNGGGARLRLHCDVGDIEIRKR